MPLERLGHEPVDIKRFELEPQKSDPSELFKSEMLRYTWERIESEITSIMHVVQSKPNRYTPELMDFVVLAAARFPGKLAQVNFFRELVTTMRQYAHWQGSADKAGPLASLLLHDPTINVRKEFTDREINNLHKDAPPYLIKIAFPGAYRNLSETKESITEKKKEIGEFLEMHRINPNIGFLIGLRLRELANDRIAEPDLFGSFDFTKEQRTVLADVVLKEAGVEYLASYWILLAEKVSLNPKRGLLVSPGAFFEGAKQVVPPEIRKF